jgi:precorrin-6B methylase 2
MIAGVASPARPQRRIRAAQFPENAFMTARSRFVSPALLLALVVSAAPLFAQATQTPAKPQTQKPAPTQKPYEPQVGQEGKDVVWVPTPQALVDKMLDMAKVTPQDFLIDLGSGDGRTVITAAKRGTRAIGIEYNPDMVELSKRNAAAAGVSDKASFMKADLFETDLSKATVITMFLLPSINMKLRPTILNLKPGTRVVSNTFTMEDWQADETATISDDCTSWCTALLWIVPAKVEGAWTMPQGELKLTQQFQNVTGTLGSTAVTGKLRGNDLSFTAGNVKYSGKVEGSMIHGTSAGTNGKPWMATRK